MTPTPPSLLITGASGFVGSHLAEMALDEGYEVWAAIRATSSRRYLTDNRLNILTLNLDDPDALKGQIQQFAKQRQGRAWDYVIHAAGATKARDEEAFMRANCLSTQHLVEALTSLGCQPRRFVFISSLSAVPMSGGLPAGETAPTAYGRSKYQAEQALSKAARGMSYIILRPTGVYGPRERDDYLLARSISRHVDCAGGFKPQLITFIYVKDLCQAALSALTKGQDGHVYQLSDGQTYHSRQFSLLLQREMGVRHVVRITVPLWLLKVVCCAGEALSRLTHRMTVINKDKYNKLKQRDRLCDKSQAEADLEFRPRYDHERRVAETFTWYKKEKWI